jgi:cyclophilin family peptidyl-prolyl cis-trans isomerase
LWPWPASGFCDGKAVLRVVPNFVIQGGDERGDGYGSLDYVLATELDAGSYGEGALGMGNEGKDTEGTQWFVTRNPAPHLDGVYTRFGTVVAGMQAVHEIEIGDPAVSVTVP